MQAAAEATHQVGTMDRSPRGPLELRLHSGCLQGGLLIACSSTNWFSARSEPEWQGVKGGISCFCIYNSVASCVYVCMPRRVYWKQKWMDTHLLIHICLPIIFAEEENDVYNFFFFFSSLSPVSSLELDIMDRRFTYKSEDVSWVTNSHSEHVIMSASLFP